MVFKGFLQLKIKDKGNERSVNYDNIEGYEADNPTAFNTTKKLTLYLKNGKKKVITADRIKFIIR